MIIARFYKNSDDKMLGFQISGHADYSENGNDIACASVSSAVMNTVNTITDVFKVDAKVAVEENEIILKLRNDEDGNGDKLLLGLLMHMYLMSDEFTGCIKIENKTV